MAVQNVAANFAGSGVMSPRLNMRARIAANFAGAGAISPVLNLRERIVAAFAGAGGWATSDDFNLRQILPDADASAGPWLDQSFGTPLWDDIDDASDADYIQSTLNPASDVCKISLSDPLGTVNQPFWIIYRYRKDNNAGTDLQVRLLEGTTERALWFHNNIPLTFTTANQLLTNAQFAAITDFKNLFLEFTAGNFVYSFNAELREDSVGPYASSMELREDGMSVELREGSA